VLEYIQNNESEDDDNDEDEEGDSPSADKKQAPKIGTRKSLRSDKNKFLAFGSSMNAIGSSTQEAPVYTDVKKLIPAVQ
jgi:hypothetical protein